MSDWLDEKVRRIEQCLLWMEYKKIHDDAFAVAKRRYIAEWRATAPLSYP